MVCVPADLIGVSPIVNHSRSKGMTRPLDSHKTGLYLIDTTLYFSATVFKVSLFATELMRFLF